MSRKQTRDYLWNTIGVFAQNAISPLLLVAVTRINGVYDSGIFSFAFSVALIFWALAIWGGRTYQVSDRKHEFSYHSYILVRVILGIAVLIGSIIFCIMNGYDSAKTTLILLLVLFKVVESISDALYGILQVKDRLHESGISLLIKATLGGVGFIITNLATGSLVWSAMALVVINILVFFSYDLVKARKANYQIESMTHNFTRFTEEATVIVRRCAPIAAVMLLSMFSLNIPRYFLDTYQPEEVGYFGIIAMPITVLTLFITFLLQPKIIQLTEFFTGQHYRELNRSVKNVTLLTILLGVVGIGVVYIAGIPLLNIVFGLNFEPYLAALMIIMIGAMANGVVSIYINIFTVIRHFKVVFFTLFLTNILLAFTSVGVIAEYGLTGAVILFTVVNIIQALILIVTYKLILSDLKANRREATLV